MNLTKNEKTLLLLLSIIIIFIGIYKFIITPQSSKLENLTQERYEYKEKISQMNNILKGESKVLKEWDDLNNEKNIISEKYFSELDQSEIIYLLNDLFENEEIEILDIHFNKKLEEQIDNLTIQTMEVYIPYKASYEGIIEIIQNIALSSKQIIMTDIIIDKDEDFLVGSMLLKIYSIEGLSNPKIENLYISYEENSKKGLPFGTPRENLESEIDSDKEILDLKYEIIDKNIYCIEDDSIKRTISKPIVSDNVSPYIKETLSGFENKSTRIIPSYSLIRENLGQPLNSESKKHSLRFEYNITAMEEENRDYIDVSKENILLKYPLNSIGLWVYSYNYSFASLGVRFFGQMGENIDLLLVERIGWTGWKYIEVTITNDLDIYPLKLNSLYLELPEGREDFGVILLDKLEAVYNANPGGSSGFTNCSDYIFHIVEKDDSVENISLKYYETEKYKEEISKLNEIKLGEKLYIGKILVLRNR